MIRVLFENIGWKIFALAVAAALWAVLAASPELVTSISAPIEYQNMPPELEMSSDAPDHVYLEVQGPSARLHDYDLSRSAVVLNLSVVRAPGEQTFTIERRNIDLPVGVRLVRTVPSQLRLSFERQVQGVLPIRVRIAAPPPAGYRVRQEKVDPKTVQVIGPESRIQQLSYAETDPIDLSRVVGESQFQVHTYVDDPHVRIVSSPMATVNIALERRAR